MGVKGQAEQDRGLLLPFMKREGDEEIDLQGDVTIFFKAFIVCEERERNGQEGKFCFDKVFKGRKSRESLRNYSYSALAAVKIRG